MKFCHKCLGIYILSSQLPCTLRNEKVVKNTLIIRYSNKHRARDNITFHLPFFFSFTLPPAVRKAVLPRPARSPNQGQPQVFLTTPVQLGHVRQHYQSTHNMTRKEAREGNPQWKVGLVWKEKKNMSNLSMNEQDTIYNIKLLMWTDPLHKNQISVVIFQPTLSQLT